MSVPFKAKLSYVWERATRQDRIYSHVFEQRTTSAVIGQPETTRINTKVYLWLKATKVEGSPDTFRAEKCQYQVFARPNWENVSDQRSYKETLISGVYTGEQMKEFIKNWEKETLKDEKALPTAKQPFKGFVKTRLAAY